MRIRARGAYSALRARNVWLPHWLGITLRNSRCPAAGRCQAGREALLLRFGVPRVQAVEEAVKLVGHVGVIERDGMRVVPQGGGRVPVAEAGLGLEQQPLIHQVGGHAVAEAVQSRMLDARGLPGA